MVRTQVLLTKHQHQRLKVLSTDSGASLSALVRLAVDRLIAEKEQGGVAQALQLLGRFEADVDDAATHHDHYLWGERDE